MPTITIQLLSGPGAGRSAVFTTSPITFGRDVENTLVITDPLVSRRHGEVRFENGAWHLINFSSNGAKVNRTSVSAKPQKLKDQDVIGVADQKLFVVTIPAGQEEPTPVAAAKGKPPTDKPAAPSGQKLSPRTKILIGVNAFWLIGGIIMLIAFSRQKPAASAPQEFLTEDQITKDLTRPLDKKAAGEIISDVEAETVRTQANNAYDQSRDNYIKKFEAYQKYRQLSASGKPLGSHAQGQPTDKENEVRFYELRTALIEKLTAMYAKARSVNNDPVAAAEIYKEISQICLPDRDGSLYQNVVKLERQLREQIAARKKSSGSGLRP